MINMAHGQYSTPWAKKKKEIPRQDNQKTIYAISKGISLFNSKSTLFCNPVKGYSPDPFNFFCHSVAYNNNILLYVLVYLLTCGAGRLSWQREH